jgi:hypothetical protein
MKFKILFIGFMLVSILFFTGCTEETGIKTTLTEIKVGDMPTDDFENIWINFSEIRLHNNETGWETIQPDEEKLPIDLLDLHVKDINETLGIDRIPIGNYTKLWLNITNATGKLKEENGGEIIEFTIPSGVLKIQQLFKLGEGENTITVDIDLNNSILKYGNGENYKLLPVISRLTHKHNNQIKFQEKDKKKLHNMIENRAPIIDVVTNGSRGKPVTTTIGQEITFNASETFDIDGDDIIYNWDFGDGGTGVGEVITHIYNNQGSYWVTLTATDGILDSSYTIQIHVSVKKGVTPP